MLMVLSPAKSLVEGPAVPELEASQPQMLDQTRMLLRTTRRLSPAKLKGLMSISDKLAQLNHGRFQAFEEPLTADNSRQAVRMFNGDVYLGLDASTLSPEDLAFGQDKVAILSGFYGLLRPLDLIQPYRLEMGTKLKTRRGTDLYAFWGDRITKRLKRWLREHDDRTVVNLASQEYFRSVQPTALPGPVITPRFLDVKDGKARVLSFFAKRARGHMVRWALQHRVSSPEALKDFDGGGYTFREELSEETTWTFTRPQPPPVGA
ncbi:MAG: peroxide stress protein YaaA [Myxococcales bacterium]|nr:peroxide stress protein YaaA [Myxococcales bacterium]